MFLSLVFVFALYGCFSVHCLVPVPTIYIKAESALNQYRTHPFHDPVIYSLLNVLIHNKQTKAFITDQAIEISLEHIKEFDQQAHTHSEPLLREIIFGSNCEYDPRDCPQSKNRPAFKPSMELTAQISSELDKFFDSASLQDYLNMNTKNHQ